jgi:UDPglucose--hexose-1-phosphate uridylyltransferase
VILAPRRAKRPDESTGVEPVCPFCPGKEANDKEVYRVGGEDTDANWQIRVIHNKFPFASIHEVIVHSPNHHQSFGELPLPQVELILKTYVNRFKKYEKDGQVYIFHNREKGAGESLPHPHSQLAVLPFEVDLDIPRLATPMEMEVVAKDQTYKETNHFVIFCPKTSQWPDEVWIAPKERGNLFSSIKDNQISDLAFTLSRLIQIFDLRHGLEFPFNFYIYPGGDWYIRIIPRVKILGGFELGTGIYVNTQDPKETAEFIKRHFDHPNKEEIQTIHRANYHKEGV